MTFAVKESGHLLLVGPPDSTLGVAAEMARSSEAALAVCDARGDALERLWSLRSDLVMVDVPVDVPEVLARLRGEHRLLPPRMIDGLVGRTVADVERELILQTLVHCRGNRTSASNILGISVRTMRNKLRTFIEDGIPVLPAL
ncbi:helix-turn-helix domain-containing protein [Sphingomonas sp. KC8]|uniref:helix-turn-helix domain-containing protein n=1 Tax=Sphingomonas sp. KC8 TaxID=1030157 RepID=UPI0002488614|nr:helix-turn-helix domain-containing protein [Sphingomonas sp. KC8]ARS28938.1 flagellar gene transcriptional regulator [Sphingomonas sp. KC8]